MKIKNLEQAEALPTRASMRKSSGYDSWECNRHYGRGIYAWTRNLVEKNVGNSFDSTYSTFKKSLSDKHISQKYCEEMIWYFKDITNYHEYRYHYWLNEFYIDTDGILQKGNKKRKNRDRTINYGEPEYIYTFKETFKRDVDKYKTIISFMIQCFGKQETFRKLEEGITQKEYNDYVSNAIRRFNNLCYKHNIKSSRWSYGHLTWTDIWEGWVKYPYSVTYKYRSPKYYQYRYETASITRKYYREQKQEKIDKFNRQELAVNPNPILIL